MIEKSSIYTYARHLRSNQTRAEKMFWKRVRANRLNEYKIRRQHPIENLFIVDFYCSKARLIIEIDGPIHDLDHVSEYDQIREKMLLRNDYSMIRFTNDRIYHDIERVLFELVNKIESII